MPQLNKEQRKAYNKGKRPILKGLHTQKAKPAHRCIKKAYNKAYYK